MLVDNIIIYHHHNLLLLLQGYPRIGYPASPHLDKRHRSEYCACVSHFIYLRYTKEPNLAASAHFFNWSIDHCCPPLSVRLKFGCLWSVFGIDILYYSILQGDQSYCTRSRLCSTKWCLVNTTNWKKIAKAQVNCTIPQRDIGILQKVLFSYFWLIVTVVPIYRP